MILTPLAIIPAKATTAVIFFMKKVIPAEVTVKSNDG